MREEGVGEEDGEEKEGKREETEVVKKKEPSEASPAETPSSCKQVAHSNAHDVCLTEFHNLNICSVLFSISKA